MKNFQRVANVGAVCRKSPFRRLVSVPQSKQAASGAHDGMRRDIFEGDGYASAECADSPPEPVTYAARRGE